MDSWNFQAARILAALRGRSAIDSVVERTPLPGAESSQLDDTLRFTLRLAHALLSYGLPVHRMEEIFGRLADALGFEASYYITPTGFIASLRHGQEQRVRILPITPDEVDLERLSALHDLVGRVERREITPGDATDRIDALLAMPPRYSAWLTLVAVVLVSVASAILLGGSFLDVGITAGLAFFVSLLRRAAVRWIVVSRLLVVTSALFIAFTTVALTRVGLPLQPSVVALASLIVLLPGLTMTVAMIELANAHLLAGTSRMAGAAICFLQLGFGGALGFRIATNLPASSPIDLNPYSVPEIYQSIAPLLATIGFVLLLKVRPRDIGWVFTSCMLALVGLRIGAFLGPEMGAFVGAFAVGTASSAFARWKDRPAALLLVPGVIMMVPGSLGFVTLSSLLAQDPSAGLLTGFTCLLVALAIATGVIFATVLIPSTRPL